MLVTMMKIKILIGSSIIIAITIILLNIFHM